MEAIHWIIIGILILSAYMGLFFPSSPDIPLVLGAFLYFHLFVDSSVFGWFFWLMAGSLTLIFMLIDYIAGGVAAKRFGGSKWSLIAAPIGAILLIWLPLGILIGPLLSVLLVEYYLSKDWDRSLKIAFTTMIGFLGGMVVKFFIMSGLVLWFVVAVI